MKSRPMPPSAHRKSNRKPLCLVLVLALAGCAGPADRKAIYAQLSPATVAESAWGHMKGTYTGPVRASTQRTGFEGQSSTEVRLDTSGPADAPDVVLQCDRGYSTAWSIYGERKGVYTNIPSRRYSSQGFVYATSHAPNQLLLQMHRYGLCPGIQFSMILTFRRDGNVSAEWIGPSGWHGDGELWRVPLLVRQQ